MGKTTTALNLASALEAEHKRVLLIDNDPQGNLTASMGFTPAEQKYTLANLLLSAIDYPEDLELHLPRCILHTDGKPDLIPANRRLTDAAARLQVMQLSQYSAANDSGRCAEQMLAQVLAPLREDYDYIIIDCGLKQELLTVNALSASDSCIIQVQSHFPRVRGHPGRSGYGAFGAEALQSRAENCRGSFLPCIRSRPQLCKSVQQSVREVYGDDLHVFDRPIEYTIRIAECPMAGMSILDYEPGNPAAGILSAACRGGAAAWLERI